MDYLKVQKAKLLCDKIDNVSIAIEATSSEYDGFFEIKISVIRGLKTAAPMEFSYSDQSINKLILDVLKKHLDQLNKQLLKM